MSARNGIFAGEDPYIIARKWLAEAEAVEPNDANAIALATVDADGMPAYLESTNPRNVPLYERFGFRVTAEIQAGSSPPMHAMWRPAR